jgi:coenzyme Q-binding protein COQ10
MYYQDIKTISYPIELLFDVVIDVARYPEFLPWCAAARILKVESQSVFYAELVINFKGLAEKYTSKITMTKPNEVLVQAISGPFKHLTNTWKLKQVDNHTEVFFEIDFEFNSKLLESFAGLFFDKAVTKMVAAFENEVKRQYDR